MGSLKLTVLILSSSKYGELRYILKMNFSNDLFRQLTMQGNKI